MRTLDFILIVFGKFLHFLCSYARLGSGSSFPGRMLLVIDSQIIKRWLSKQDIKVIVVTGTNGKTTTAKLLEHILKNNNISCFRNSSGANLFSGIASCLIKEISVFGLLKEKVAIFEIDENVVDSFIKQAPPSMVIFLNLFRDQLDRYGEIDRIIKRWEKALYLIPFDSVLVGNADDPQIVHLLQKAKNSISYFGLPENQESLKPEKNLADIVYCPSCITRFEYKERFCGHLGLWECPKCRFSRPNVFIKELVDVFQADSLHQYNALAALCASEKFGICSKQARHSLQGFKPAFGRGEIVRYRKKKAHLLLAKNPISFTDSLKTLSSEKAKVVFLILNNHCQDGKDVSWIWDVDFSEVLKMEKIVISGNCAKELRLRLSYSLHQNTAPPIIYTEKRVKKALKFALSISSEEQPLFIIPTYTALLEINKYFKGADHLCT